jgi:hypothetical protein
MPKPPRRGAPRGVAPTLHTLYASQLAAVVADRTAPRETDLGDERGWLLSSGAARAVEPFLTALPADDADLARYAGLSGPAAARLLGALAPHQLDDRQNDAPTLSAMLRAAVAHPEGVEVHGYLVGPARRDERVTAEGVDVYGLHFLDVRSEHDPDCQCELLWDAVVDQLGIADAVTGPHEITLRINPWRPNEPCWRLWWD